MARDTFTINPDRPFVHRPVDGPGALKAGATVDANDVVDQIVTLAGAKSRIKVWIKTAAGIDGDLDLKLMRPTGQAADVYDAAAFTVAVTGGTETSLEIESDDWYGESQALLSFTGDAGIAAPGVIEYIDIAGV